MELPACPVETTLMLIGDKWKVLILRDLMDGTKRFGCRTSSEGAAPGCETTMLTSGRSIFGIAVTASLLKL